MNHYLTAKATSWILLFAVLVLLIPVNSVLANGVGGFFYNWIVIGFFGWLLGLAGGVLNYAINYFVIGFGIQFGTAGVGNVVNVLWATVRDLFNLTFIFGLVYIGFKMILRTDDGQTKRWLVQLIIAALLVNFSLFITKFIVDVSNILATELLEDGRQQGLFLAMDVELNGVADAFIGVDLSGALQQVLNVNTTASPEASGALGEGGNGGFSFIFGTLIVFLVATFVYLSLAVVLIIRGAVLLVLMILSPFLFLGMVLPPLKSFSSRLWSTLLQRAFTAPILILLLYITIRLAEQFTLAVNGLPGDFAVATAGASAGTSGTETMANVTASFGPFIIIIVLLLMSLVAAQKLGAEGASTTIKAAQNIRQRGQRAVSNSARWTGRQTRRAAGAATVGVGAAAMRNYLGRKTYNYTQSDAGKKAATGGAWSRAKVAAAKKVSESSFDPRSAKSGAWARNTGGYAATAKANAKAEQQRAKDAERKPYDEYGRPTQEFQAKLDGDEKLKNLKTAEQKAQQDVVQATQELGSVQAENATAMQEVTNAINELNTQIANPVANGLDASDIAKKESEREGLQRQQVELQKREQAAQKKLQDTKNVAKSAEKATKTRTTALEGEHKYEYVNQLAATREKEKQRWSDMDNVRATVASAGAGAAIGTAVAGPVGAIVGGVIGAIAKSTVVKGNAGAAETRFETITSEYGIDPNTANKYDPNIGQVGGRKVKNQERDNILKTIGEELKANEPGPTDTKDSTSTTS